MKKRLSALVLSFLLLLAISTVLPKNLSDDNSKVYATVSFEENLESNYSISNLKKVWQGKSQEEFDAYFADLPDARRIFADEYGGISFFLDEASEQEANGLLGEITYADGTVYQPDLYGPDATTVGEVRRVMAKYLD